MTISFVLVAMALLPVLWPLILILGLIVAVIATARAKKRYPDESLKELLGKVPNDRDLKSARRSLFAIGLNLTLYVILAGHSWIFYILPLKNDLKPIRQQETQHHQQQDTETQ